MLLVESRFGEKLCFALLSAQNDFTRTIRIITEAFPLVLVSLRFLNSSISLKAQAVFASGGDSLSSSEIVIFSRIFIYSFEHCGNGELLRSFWLHKFYCTKDCLLKRSGDDPERRGLPPVRITTAES